MFPSRVSLDACLEVAKEDTARRHLATFQNGFSVFMPHRKGEGLGFRYGWGAGVLIWWSSDLRVEGLPQP